MRIRSILSIEDNPASARLLKQVIKRIPNVNFLSIDDPISGLEHAISHQPDLILLDINMPSMNGIQLLKQLRLNLATKNIKVLAISANAMLTDIANALSAGFDGYITKPIDVIALTKVIIENLPSSHDSSSSGLA